MSNSNERIAVVIGGASGIGWASARALAADGCRVTVADRNVDGARARAAELGRSAHRRGRSTSPTRTSVQRLFDRIGPLDVVVNMRRLRQPRADHRPGGRRVPRGRSTSASPARSWSIKHAGQQLREGGSLVSISSLNGRQPAAGMSAYCAAKAGLSMLTQVAALEMGAARHPGQRRGARVRAHPADRAGHAGPGRASRTTWRTPRSAGRARPRTSPTRWCSCARRSRRG